MKNVDNHKDNRDEKVKNRALIFILLYVLPILFILFAILNFLMSNPQNNAARWIALPDLQLINQTVIQNHYAALIGLPMAAIFSLWVVLILKNQSGIIEFKIIGLEFRGVSGQVILWILCFLTITIAIKLVW